MAKLLVFWLVGVTITEALGFDPVGDIAVGIQSLMPYMLYYMVDNLSDLEYVSVRNQLARLVDEIVTEKGKKTVPEDKAELVASKVVRRRLRELGLWIDDGKDDDEDDEDY